MKPKVEQVFPQERKKHICPILENSSSALSFKESPHFLVSLSVGELGNLVSPHFLLQNLWKNWMTDFFFLVFSPHLCRVWIYANEDILGVQQLHLGCPGLSLTMTDPWRWYAEGITTKIGAGQYLIWACPFLTCLVFDKRASWGFFLLN